MNIPLTKAVQVVFEIDSAREESSCADCFVARYYDPNTASWCNLPTVYSRDQLRVYASIAESLPQSGYEGYADRFLVALFTKPVSTPTPTSTLLPTPTERVTKQPTATQTPTPTPVPTPFLTATASPEKITTVLPTAAPTLERSSGNSEEVDLVSSRSPSIVVVILGVLGAMFALLIVLLIIFVIVEVRKQNEIS